MGFPYLTPWGTRDAITVIIPDKVAVVSTPSHGGIIVSNNADLLSRPARKRAIHVDGWMFFEEDCDWAIPAFEIEELREWAEKHAQADVNGALIAWNADYLMECGIDPYMFDNYKYHKQYVQWLERKIDNLMREYKHPDKVVTRSFLPDKQVAVTTASGDVFVFVPGSNRANRLGLVTAERAAD